MISIGLPIYKGKFLEEAINSVLNQTYGNFELILLNDGSPDNIDDIVNNFKDSRIKYYKNEYNYGLNNLIKTWNKCLELSKGEYFTLFADDDFYEENFLKYIVQYIEKYPSVNIFHSKVKIVNENNKLIGIVPSCPEYETGLEFIWHRIKGLRLHYAPDFVVKTTKLKEIGGFVNFPLGWCSDDATWFKIAIDNGIVYVKEAVLYRREYKMNISMSGNIIKRFEAIKLYEKWLDDFLSSYTIKNNEEGIIIFDINKTKLNTFNNYKMKLLLDKYGENIFDIIGLIIFWIRNHNKYSLSIKLLIKALFRIIKKNIEP